MYGIVRQYTGAAPLVDKLRSDEANVTKLLSAAPGFIAYYAIRTEDGVATISICHDQAGADETSRIAANYLRENFSGDALNAVGAPRISRGEIIIRA